MLQKDPEGVQSFSRGRQPTEARCSLFVVEPRSGDVPIGPGVAVAAPRLTTIILAIHRGLTPTAKCLDRFAAVIASTFCLRFLFGFGPS